ncbi:hypothetical protein J7L27_03415 [Candidatus Bathyarchaeota archaeon]|mgnify:CR=1 FL=1|nr:hypothetical protein [Candidatus Bathyarchaeota archaeon]
MPGSRDKIRVAPTEMGIKEIEEEYERFKSELRKIVEEEIEKINEKVSELEIEAEKTGREIEEKLNNKENSK